MIYGIGTDICDVRRIRASLDRHGERFAKKILSEGEMKIWHERSATLAFGRPHVPRHCLRNSISHSFILLTL